MRSIPGKAHATRLEGSLANEKNHYLLSKIKAWSKATEIAWIFFGMLTRNALTITKRRKGSKAKKKASLSPDKLNKRYNGQAYLCFVYKITEV